MAKLEVEVKSRGRKSVLPDFVGVVDIETEVVETTRHVEDEFFSPQWVQCLVHCGRPGDTQHDMETYTQNYMT